MHTSRYGHGLLLLLLLAVFVPPAEAQKRSTPSPMLTYGTAILDAGDGYLTAGDLWDTVKPPTTTESSRLGNVFSNLSMNNRMLFGPRASWQEPAGTWPSGYNYTNKFRNSHFFTFPVFKASGWPGYGEGNPVRALDASEDAQGAGGTSRFMFATYGPNVPGANDPSRNYKREATFTDLKRTQLVYEAGWPTTAGIDFKLRARQYSSNEQNLNDFIVIELTMTNTGVVDSNGDGTPEATDNVIDGVAISMDATISPSIRIGSNGDRNCNCISGGRTFGYVAAPDETGAPLDMFVYYSNVPATATAGRATPALHNFGINGFNVLEGYTDVWNGWTWLGARQGAISDGPFGGPDANSPDKLTAFGTPSVGDGAQRGWYASSQWQSSGYSANASDLAFRHATATWYEDYGKRSDGSTIPFNLAPNPAFFSGGTADDITTFVVGNPNARPNGDFKYASEDISKAVGIEQPVWEPTWNPGAAGSDFYDGAVGYTKEYTFSQVPSSTIGPFDLAVGESMTISWVSYAGYRLEGAVDALKAARWAWEKGWDIESDMPTPPAPEMNVESTPDGLSLVRWTDVSSLDGNIDGYKIWRAAQYQRTDYLDKGMRLVDRYQQQHEVGASTDGLLDPVNPNFNAEEVFVTDIQGTYQPSEWGTYELVAKIPNGDLSQFQDAANGYSYSWVDEQSIVGFTYWYYVSAYNEGSFTGPQGPVTAGHIESSNLNRNGRNSPEAPLGTIGLASLWGGTYPYATTNAQFPAQQAQPLRYKNIGAAFTVTPPVADPADVADLITVTPNPYKVTGLNDVRSNASSHNIDFLNLPANYTLTILDVSGQVVFQTSMEGAVDGKFTWDLFSKDGIEVSSGLYIYHVEHSGGESTGHFAILR